MVVHRKKGIQKKNLRRHPMPQVFDEAAENDDDIPDAFAEENAALDDAVTDTASTSTADGNALKDRPKRGRKPLPPHLLLEDVIHDLPDSEKLCACDEFLIFLQHLNR